MKLAKVKNSKISPMVAALQLKISLIKILIKAYNINSM